MNKLTWTLFAVFMAVLAASVVCIVFETPFAEASIDWFSFFAGAFLAAEGTYKIIKYRKAPSSVQFCRFIRIFIGANVFLVHLAEFIWGPHAPAQASALLGTIIDWTAFSFGIFLVAEGITRIITVSVSSIEYRGSSSEMLSGHDTRPTIPDPGHGTYTADQITRTMRVMIGSSVFTIHLLQFMR